MFDDLRSNCSDVVTTALSTSRCFAASVDRFYVGVNVKMVTFDVAVTLNFTLNGVHTRVVHISHVSHFTPL